MPLSRAEIQKRYREKKKRTEGEKYLKAERERKKKYYIPVENLSKDELAKRRSQTLNRVKRFLKKKKEIQSTELDSPITNNTRSKASKSSTTFSVRLDFGSHKKGASIRKRHKTALRQAYRKIKDLKLQNDTLVKQKNRYAKRMQRLRKTKLRTEEIRNPKLAQANERSVPDTPKTKTNEFMRRHGLNPDEHKEVRKELLFSNVLVEGIRVGIKDGTRKRHKLGKQHIISGKVIRSYRFSSKLSRSLGVTRKLIRRSVSRGMNAQVNAKTNFVRSKVRSFLLREDNCTLLPGKKDVKKVGDQTEQKRVLSDYLHNLFMKFKLEYPDLKISRATFCRLRPEYVLTANFCSRATCLCSRHQNTALKLKALKNCGAAVNVNPDCFIEQYQDEVKIGELFDGIKKSEITFSEWKKVQDNGKFRCRQVQTVVTMEIFKDIFQKEIAEFRSHVERVKNQYSEMKHLRENLAEGQILVWMDFAENFSCTSVDEVQSAYWNNSMVTLHTHVVYFPKSFQQTHQSIVGISESLSHNASSVFAMLRKLVPLLKQMYPSLTTIHYLTDSPTSQYRNKTMFYLLAHHQEIFNDTRATWDFLEAGHGKGPCDGLGASVKRSADMDIKQGKCVIQTAEDFYAWTVNLTSSCVKYFYVSNQDVEDCSQYIQSVSSEILAVPGTMKIHSVCPTSPEFVMVRHMSCHCQGCNNISPEKTCEGWNTYRITKAAEHQTTESDTDVDNNMTVESDNNYQKATWQKVEVGEADFVAAVYEGSWYIGKVTSVDDDDEVQITFMEQCPGKISGIYRWPSTPDEIWVSTAAVLKLIPEPLPNGRSKRMFRVAETERDAIESKFKEWNKQ